MNPNNRVGAPNVHLFAFHVWDILSSGSISPTNPRQPALPPTSNPQHLWEKCNEILQEKLHINAEFNDTNLYKTAQPPGRRVNLMIGKAVNNRGSLYLSKHISHENQEISLTGLAQPLRIDDSYALGFNLRVPEKTNDTKTPDVDISIFQRFNPDNCLLQNSVNSYFPQTLLLTAWLTEAQKAAVQEDPNYIKSLGQLCLKSFISGENFPEFYREGELFGSPILEYGYPNYPDKFGQILIWFFESQTTGDIWDTYYSDFLDLCLYRNKVILAYKESRAYYLEIRKEYAQIDVDIESTFQYLQHDEAYQRQGKDSRLKKEELEYLESQTINMPPRAVKYARLLIEMEIRQNTIAINAKNYQNKLNQISLDIKARKIYNNRDTKNYSDLSFLELFSKETCPQFSEQIKADLGYFKYGTVALDKAMEAIRGVVAIAQADRDAKLEATIQTVGSALGLVGIVASVAPYSIKQDPPDRKFYFPLSNIEIPSFLLVLLISMGAGFGVWMSVWAIAKIKQILPRIKQRLPFR
ncbi:MAG: hypothetical protein JGK17_04105 [Microcoleus sp. PH2017_10_PVI_O_A]|uniref:hypothetical protein n=1 Tax=unclassified Microcoleus TaxID=2642155 RepID=UPI001DA0063D|nr:MULTISPECIES: hypothetical protein [unclassified Microcoleus]TAE85356.1 MAG: hypothetical protein EAZ83_03000 [Oscillatoriales cyanobacterium]MCC3404770.1 hypothetical protein [Microcoleus sp. PH2017_10_PVI_O_A]MCC3458839.1 hypothetical protein [Microcoleus sp. PH2017_11_PCY_U_A]MCC3477036.1 hypothetical protein [Microcoleus sp. PH2017_12_PCY_D_A]MCC3527523.1 hypothetical protein [Microcoleus sp. PH2017_21_RUC_O_A]